LDIHLIAIGGTGMAPLACLLKGRGHNVRGSDGPLYPPMSTLLAETEIEPLVGFDPAHLEPAPDLVVVGNAVPRHNPQAVAMEAMGLARCSMPEAVQRFFLPDKRSLVVAGTHGKTTTTSIAAWVYTALGRDPGYLVGGVPQNLARSFHDGGGERFIIEGDEYNAAYFDRGPKFLHYQPESLILTSVEYDHADLYATPEALLEAYASLVDLLPTNGLLVAYGDSDEVRRIAERALCPVLYYGLGEENDLCPLGEIHHDERGSRFKIWDPEGTIEITLPLSGEHNVCNALAVWAVARRDGIPALEVAGALGRFTGVKRRMEELGSAGGVLVVDDFAHHPTAVEKTLDAARRHYPGRRLVVAFEPRSLTAGQHVFFDAYLQSFLLAGRAYFAPVYHAERLGEDARLDLDTLCSELAVRGVQAVAASSHEELLNRLLADLKAGDVVVTMSSGDFSALPQRLLEGLRAAESAD
jgi:UDP-N-acetylmuramate: L-alanyl-gamma-D-glutamyl-meso-diaminopimelate ligase